MTKASKNIILSCIFSCAIAFFAYYSFSDKSNAVNENLWRQEIDRLRSIMNTLPNDFEKTTFLRKYCGELMGIGVLSPDTAEMYKSLDFNSFNPADFFHLYKSDSLATDCGTSSFFYGKLLQEFGYNAYQYSFGFRTPPYQRFVHSFCIVEIEYECTKRLIVQDPYLNLTYNNKEMKPIDFYWFLSKLKQKKYDEIIMVSSSVATTLIVPDPTMYLPYLNDSCKYLLRSRLLRQDGSVRKNIPIKRNYETIMNSHCNSFEKGFLEAMQAHDITEPFIYAYVLKVADMVGSSNVRLVEEKIDSILFNTVLDNPL